MSNAVEEAGVMHEALGLVERWKNAVNSGDMKAFGALFAPDAVLFTPFSPDPIRGREAIQEAESNTRTAFPNATLTLHKPVAHGETVAVEWEYGGKNTGPITTPMRIIPPTNREMHLHGASFLHVHNGLVTQERRYYDVRSLFQQLGL